MSRARVYWGMFLLSFGAGTLAVGIVNGDLLSIALGVFLVWRGAVRIREAGA